MTLGRKIAIAVLLFLIALFCVRSYRQSSSNSLDDVNEALKKQQDSVTVHETEHRLAEPAPAPSLAPPSPPEAPTNPQAVQTAATAYGAKLDAAKHQVEQQVAEALRELKVPSGPGLKCAGVRCEFKIKVDPADEAMQKEVVTSTSTIIGNIAQEYGKMVKSGGSTPSGDGLVDFQIEFYDTDAEADATRRDNKEGSSPTRDLFNKEGFSSYKESTSDQVEGQAGDDLGTVAGYIFAEGKKQGRIVKADHVRAVCAKKGSCRLELVFPADATPDLADADTWAYKSLLTQGAPAVGVEAHVTTVGNKLQNGMTFLNISQM